MHNTNNWLQLQRDSNSGIETLRAHFKGHAYDPHWHDTYLLGFTEQGVQQFNCRRKLCTSTAGGNFLIEPGEIHDGRAPENDGFTYRQLYIPEPWLKREMASLFPELPDTLQLSSAATLIEDKRLTSVIAAAFMALQQGEPAIVREACLDQLLVCLTAVLKLQQLTDNPYKVSVLARQARSFLHANLECDINLEQLAQQLNTDRFRITRAFKQAYNIAPHAYLIQLRLSRARELLSGGTVPAEVAAKLCFADQSHLGRWFRRAYRLTPAQYAKCCTNLPDSQF
ncbi:MAG: AraC-like DNA-binding protein [Oceanospirillaceae bacterium]|jgi:AraC-like DNA-binding protein